MIQHHKPATEILEQKVLSKDNSSYHPYKRRQYLMIPAHLLFKLFSHSHVSKWSPFQLSNSKTFPHNFCLVVLLLSTSHSWKTTLSHNSVPLSPVTWPSSCPPRSCFSHYLPWYPDYTISLHPYIKHLYLQPEGSTYLLNGSEIHDFSVTTQVSVWKIILHLYWWLCEYKEYWLQPQAFLVIPNPRQIYTTAWHSKSLFIQSLLL